MVAGMSDAIVSVHQAVVAAIRVGAVNWVVPVWLVGCVEVELAHLGKVALGRVVDQEGFACVEGSEIVQVFVGVF